MSRDPTWRSADADVHADGVSLGASTGVPKHSSYKRIGVRSIRPNQPRFRTLSMAELGLLHGMFLLPLFQLSNFAFLSGDYFFGHRTQLGILAELQLTLAMSIAPS
jgi:hypothetical protein